MTLCLIEYKLNPPLLLIYFILWIGLLFFYRKSFHFHTNRQINWKTFGIIVTLFSVFAFAEPDTYYYHTLYDKMLFLHKKVHVEDFYYWLVEVISFNYYVWRLAIWGSATLLLIWTLKLNKINNECIGLIFALVLITQFYLTRATLGVALLLFSISIFFNVKKANKVYYAIALAGCVASYFLHKSMPLFLLMSVLALCPINKATFWALVIAFPILRVVIMPFVMDFVASGYLNEDTAGFAEAYLVSERQKSNIYGMIQTIIKYTPIYLSFYILIKEYVFKKTYLPTNIRFFFHLAFILFYISSLFLGQETSNFVASRTEHVMFFPLTIVLVYYMTTTYKRTRLLKFTLVMFALSTAYSYAHGVWKYL